MHPLNVAEEYYGKEIGGKCLVTDAEFMWVKLVYGVMQKIAVGVVR